MYYILYRNCTFLYMKKTSIGLITSRPLLANVTQIDLATHVLVCEFMSYLTAQKSEILHRGITYECHSICRALALYINVTVTDGAFHGLLQTTQPDGYPTGHLYSAQHSWLITPNGAIIDPYPVGVIAPMPLLVPTTSSLIYRHFGAGLYREDHPKVKFTMTRKIWKNVQNLKKIFAEYEV